MQSTCVVVGAGPAGLAVSRELADRGVGHVVLERGEVGSTWAGQRWDSFRLNTPGWMNGTLGEVEPHSFCTRDEVMNLMATSASTLPVRTQSPVTSLTISGSGFLLRTPAEELRASCVVLASGLLNVPRKSEVAGRLPRRLLQLHAADYRSPQQLPPGAVLVVGGAQSGCQIAEDLARSGRQVYLSTSRVGRYAWMYRGRESLGWLVDAGFWDQQPADLDDPAVMRAAQPLVASGGRSLSLALLAETGVTLLGRIESVALEQLVLDDTVPANVEFGDQFWQRMRGLIDGYIARSGIEAPAPQVDPGAGPVRQSAPRILDLAATGVTSVVWCIGFTGDLSWVRLPIHDTAGGLHHNGCAAPVPGLWFVGFPWLTRRRSGILHGFPVDAAQTAQAVTRHLAQA